MNIFDFVSRYFVVIAIVFSGINYLTGYNFDSMDDLPAEARAMRRRYLNGFTVLSLVPWLVLGLGQLSGHIKSVFAIFRPQDDNPYVWAFFATILGIYLLSVYWIFFRGGARIAAELRLFRFQRFSKMVALNEFWVRVIGVGMLPFLAFWLWFVSRMDVPAL